MQEPAPSASLGQKPFVVEIDLGQAVYVLSDALDLVGVDDVHHGKRVSFIALALATRLGLRQEDLTDLCFAALIHDCGVSSTRVHRFLVGELEWENVQEHCRIGAALLRTFAPLAHLAPLVLHHHTHWRDLASSGLSERQAVLANLLFLSDRVDALRIQWAGGGETGARVTAALAGNSGLFHPRFVAEFSVIAGDEAFWEILSHPEEICLHVESCLAHALRHPCTLSTGELHGLASLFAHVVDAKSPYTARHSEGVARVARMLGERCGLPRERVDLLEIAALLHDLGKLRVPDEILEKPAALSAEEWLVMERHSYDSLHILLRIHGFRLIAEWAGLHHETPAGDGYPFGIDRSNLPLEALIVAAADTFQALAERRPYRGPLEPEQIVAILRAQVVAGHLDGPLVEMLAAELPTYRKAALAES